MSGTRNPLANLKALIEKLMPDLDHYRKTPRKARVTAVRQDHGRYLVDLKILKNDDVPDEDEPAYRKVELATGGFVPKKGSRVMVVFAKGNHPVVTAIMDTGTINLQEFMLLLSDHEFSIDEEGVATFKFKTWDMETS